MKKIILFAAALFMFGCKKCYDCELQSSTAYRWEHNNGGALPSIINTKGKSIEVCGEDLKNFLNQNEVKEFTIPGSNGYNIIVTTTEHYTCIDQ